MTTTVAGTLPRTPHGARRTRPTTWRTATPRHYLMCPPTYFSVSYAINPWMDPEAPVDVALAMTQWQALHDAYISLGHTVEVLDAIPGLPDMVFAANGAVVVDGLAMSSRFRYPERAGEERSHHHWLQRNGAREVRRPRRMLEGEGDVVCLERFLLMGSGFRSDPGAGRELTTRLATPTGRTLVPLELVDPRYYHLDTCLGVLDDHTAAYLPAAFSPASRARLAEVFPELVECSAEDAAVLGLNIVSDGRHVVTDAAATSLITDITARGFEVIGLDMSEFRKSGGAVKCCTLELRGLLAAATLSAAEPEPEQVA